MKWYHGYICDFDRNEGYYKIKYEDGDIEECDREEIATMLHKPNNNNIIQALAATWYERVEA